MQAIRLDLHMVFPFSIALRYYQLDDLPSDVRDLRGFCRGTVDTLL